MRRNTSRRISIDDSELMRFTFRHRTLDGFDFILCDGFFETGSIPYEDKSPAAWKKSNTQIDRMAPFPAN